MTDHRWILFTDLDGTLLDKETYDPGPSLAALEKCREAGIPVIFSSSKTGAEMRRIHDRYASHPAVPFIAENGGGVFLPLDHWEGPPGGERGERFWKVTLGARHEKVLGVLLGAAGRVGLRVRPLSEATPEEISRKTGLPRDEARRAGRRDFDEPFWIEGDPGRLEIAALEKQITEQGMRLTRGGRFFHVHGPSDKGKAARYLRERYEEEGLGKVLSAAVGDAANDLPMFRAADRAYLVKQAGGSYDPDIPREENLRFLAGAGPLGFCQAVDDLLEHVRGESAAR